MLTTVLSALASTTLAYFFVLNGMYAVLLVGAARELLDGRHRSWEETGERLLTSRVAPRVTILAPAYNEASTVTESVRALLTLHYPDLELVVVNDGSSDDTLGVLRRGFALVPEQPVLTETLATSAVAQVYRSTADPRLVVVDKANGGKADALNAALNAASGELVCAIDADTLVERDALLRIVRPFLDDDDVAAAGGTIRVANGSRVRHGRVVEARVPRHPVAGFQTVEYLRAFLFGRLGWNRCGGNLIISGAFGLFRRTSLLDIGGYLEATVGEDMELVARLRRRGAEQGGPGRVVFVPDPVAWTEVPQQLRVLGRQRDRWHRGLADVLWRYRGVALRPRYGALGLVVYPYFLLVELLAPVVELLGLLALPVILLTDAGDPAVIGGLLAAAYGLGLLLSLATLLMDELAFHRYPLLRDRLLLLLWAVTEPLGYRQLTILWRLRGLYRYLRGRTDWGAMVRTGFVPVDDPAPVG